MNNLISVQSTFFHFIPLHFISFFALFHYFVSVLCSSCYSSLDEIINRISVLYHQPEYVVIKHHTKGYLCACVSIHICVLVSVT